jgi:hypothetical protein
MQTAIWGVTPKRTAPRCPLCGEGRTKCKCSGDSLRAWAEKQLCLPGIEVDPHAGVTPFIRRRSR